MAILAPVAVGRSGKLSPVHVGVAVRASFELDPVKRCLAGRDMALCAGQGGVTALKRVTGRPVHFRVES
jgi:hypothetical protein